MEVNTRQSTFFFRKQANKHIITIHKQKHTHILGVVEWDHAYLDRSVFTWRPWGAVKAHKSGYFACTWEPAKHFSLLSVILIAQHDSSAPNTPSHPHPYPTPARWLFFNCLWALAPLLYHTKSPRWLGGAEGLGSSARTNGLEVAEQIKRIKRSLFTDTSKLFWRWALDPPLQYSPSIGGKIRHPQRHFQSIQTLSLGDLRWKANVCIICKSKHLKLCRKL